MFYKAKLFFNFLILASLSGCLIPEQFNAKVVFNKNGSYIFSYDGTLTYALALAEAQKGKLSTKVEADLKKEGVKLARAPGFKKVDYLGNGKYKVLVEKHGKPGEPYYFFSEESKIFSVKPQKDGTVSVSGISLDEKAIQELSTIGAKIDGTLTVLVDSGAKVLKHNAQSQPSAFGLLGGYKWQIKSPDEEPFILIQPYGVQVKTDASSESNQGSVTSRANNMITNELKFNYIGYWKDPKKNILIKISKIKSSNNYEVFVDYGSENETMNCIIANDKMICGDFKKGKIQPDEIDWEIKQIDENSLKVLNTYNPDDNARGLVFNKIEQREAVKAVDPCELPIQYELVKAISSSEKVQKKIKKIDTLLKKGAKLNCPSPQHSSGPIEATVEVTSLTQDDSLLRALMSRGMRLDAAGNTCFASAMGNLKKRNNLKLLEFMLNQGMRLDAISCGGPVMGSLTFGIATKWWNESDALALAELLIKHGVDANPKIGEGKTLIDELNKYGDKTRALVTFLKKHGESTDSAQVSAKPSTSGIPFALPASNDGEKDLFSAMLDENIETIKMLLDKGVNVNAKDGKGNSVFSRAVSTGNTRIVKMLLAKGAKDVNVSAESNDSQMDLFSAIENGNIEIVNMLLEKGANVNAKNSNGRTVLEVALYAKINLDRRNIILEMLLDKGLDLSATGYYRNPAVILATEVGNTTFVNMLIDKGVDVNIKGKRGETALHCAVGTEQPRMVKILLEKGADVNIKDREGKTIFDYITYYEIKDTQILEMLNSYAPKKNDGQIQTDQDRISYSLGQQVGSYYKRQGIVINIEIFSKAIKTAYVGENSQLSDEEMQQILEKFQEELKSKKTGALEEKNESNKDRISYSLGRQVGSYYKRQGIVIDIEIFSKAIKTAYVGENSQLSDEEMQQILEKFREEIKSKKSPQSIGEDIRAKNNYIGNWKNSIKGIFIKISKIESSNNYQVIADYGLEDETMTGIIENDKMICGYFKDGKIKSDEINWEIKQIDGNSLKVLNTYNPDDNARGLVFIKTEHDKKADISAKKPSRVNTESNDVQINSKYKDNGNGTIIASDGLMWQKEDDDKNRDFKDAIFYCKHLTLAGYSDWRLPVLGELKTLIDDSVSPTIDARFFPNTNKSYYWSSTTNEYGVYGGVDGVDFYTGKVSNQSQSKQYTELARCVRTGR